MVKKLLLPVILVGALLYSAGSAVAQGGSPIEQRIGQAVFVNGQLVLGVTVVKNGMVQSPICSSPKQYVTADQSSSGWACFEMATGAWLLHAQPS